MILFLRNPILLLRKVIIMKTLFKNARIVTPNVLKNGNVIVQNEYITDIVDNGVVIDADEVIDCHGNYLCPGFIDIHNHATVAGNFYTSDAQEMENACVFMAQHGTTSVLPTSLSSAYDNIMGFLHTVARLKGNNKGSKILGAHIESNYFNPKFAGAQSSEFIYSPTEKEYMSFYDTGVVKRVDASPEIDGVLDMARNLSKRGVTMSIAHSGADYQDVLRAIDAGFTHVTHIFNALSFLSSCYFYPKIGASEASLLHDEITVEVICDGKHIPPELIRLMHKVKGPDKIHAVTDAVMAGAPSGLSKLWGCDLLVEDGVGMLADKSSFFGSVTTNDVELRVLVNEAALSLCDAVKMLTLTPARVIGEKNIGAIAKGYYADINILDENLNVIYTMINGKKFGA